MTYNGHDVTDPNAPLGYQCGDPSCSEHGVARFNRPTTTKTITEAQLAAALHDEGSGCVTRYGRRDCSGPDHHVYAAAIFAALPTANGREGKRCNCPESGTSGSCPFHDSSTLITEPAR